jgi:pilus assembly protein Flp/PilA
MDGKVILVWYNQTKITKQLYEEVVDMLMWLSTCIRFLRNEKGQGMVEYGLILALIAVVVIGIMTTMGTNLQAMFTTVSGKL